MSSSVPASLCPFLPTKPRTSQLGSLEVKCSFRKMVLAVGVGCQLLLPELRVMSFPSSWTPNNEPSQDRSGFSAHWKKNRRDTYGHSAFPCSFVHWPTQLRRQFLVLCCIFQMDVQTKQTAHTLVPVRFIVCYQALSGWLWKKEPIQDTSGPRPWTDIDRKTVGRRRSRYATKQLHTRNNGHNAGGTVASHPNCSSDTCWRFGFISFADASARMDTHTHARKLSHRVCILPSAHPHSDGGRFDLPVHLGGECVWFCCRVPLLTCWIMVHPWSSPRHGDILIREYRSTERTPGATLSLRATAPRKKEVVSMEEAVANSWSILCFRFLIQFSNGNSTSTGHDIHRSSCWCTVLSNLWPGCWAVRACMCISQKPGLSCCWQGCCRHKHKNTHTHTHTHTHNWNDFDIVDWNFSHPSHHAQRVYFCFFLLLIPPWQMCRKLIILPRSYGSIPLQLTD